MPSTRQNCIFTAGTWPFLLRRMTRSGHRRSLSAALGSVLGQVVVLVGLFPSTHTTWSPYTFGSGRPGRLRWPGREIHSQEGSHQGEEFFPEMLWKEWRHPPRGWKGPWAVPRVLCAGDALPEPGAPGQPLLQVGGHIPAGPGTGRRKSWGPISPFSTAELARPSQRRLTLGGPCPFGNVRRVGCELRACPASCFWELAPYPRGTR